MESWEERKKREDVHETADRVAGIHKPVPIGAADSTPPVPVDVDTSSDRPLFETVELLRAQLGLGKELVMQEVIDTAMTQLGVAEKNKELAVNGSMKEKADYCAGQLTGV